MIEYRKSLEKRIRQDPRDKEARFLLLKVREKEGEIRLLQVKSRKVVKEFYLVYGFETSGEGVYYKGLYWIPCRPYFSKSQLKRKLHHVTQWCKRKRLWP